MKKRPNYKASVTDTLMENKSTEDLANSKKEKLIESTEKSEPKEESIEIINKKPAPAKSIRMPGRPRGIPKKQYSIYIPEEIIPDMAAPLQYYQGDISKYIVKLISDDLERNKESYRQLLNISII